MPSAMPSVFPPHSRLRFATLAAALAAAWTAPMQNAAAADAAPTLAPITVIDRSNQGSMRPGALRDELVKTESISERAIAKAGATNVNEALERIPASRSRSNARSATCATSCSTTCPAATPR